MTPEERIKRYQETIERLRADIEWLDGSGFYLQGATNGDLKTALNEAACLYAAIVEELSRPPG